MYNCRLIPCLKTIIFSCPEIKHLSFMQVMKWIWEVCQRPASLNYPLDTRKLRQWPWYSNQAKNKEEEGWRWGWRVWAHSRLQWRGGRWWWRYVFSFLHPSNEASHHWQVQSLNTANPNLICFILIFGANSCEISCLFVLQKLFPPPVLWEEALHLYQELVAGPKKTTL